MEESPLIKMINEKFKCISHITDISALSKEDRIKYDETIKIYRDYLAVISFAEATGREQGFKEGLEEARKERLEKEEKEGRVEENISIARRMKAKGISTELIAEITQLGKEDIEQL